RARKPRSRGGHTLAAAGKLVLRTLPIVETDDASLRQRGDRDRFELRTCRPASREAAPVKIDQDATAVRGTALWRVDKRVHTGNLRVFAIDRIEDPLPVDV